VVSFAFRAAPLAALLSALLARADRLDDDRLRPQSVTDPLGDLLPDLPEVMDEKRNVFAGRNP
jgi:hypothetical protein